MVADKDGQNLEKFISTQEIGFNKLYSVTWSQDNRRLIFAGQRQEDGSAYRTRMISIYVDSKEVADDPSIRLFEKNEWAFARGFESLKNDSGFLFVGKRNVEDPLQVWHLDLESESVRSVTRDTSDYDAVSISHDGKTVIATKADWDSGLVSFDPAKKEVRELRANSKNFFGRNGIAQTSERHLIYSVRDDDEVNLVLRNFETGDETKLTTDSRVNVQPAVSSFDGSIVFVSNRGDSFGLWKIDADGKNPVQLTKIKNGRDVTPAFINGGKTVVFQRQRNDGGKATLMKVPLSGGDAEELLPGSETSNVMVRVSPDQKKLAFATIKFDSATANLESEMRIAELDGDKAKLTPESYEGVFSQWYEWAPDGKSLMRLKTEGKNSIWRFPLDGRKETQWTELSSSDIQRFFFSRDGKKVFLVKGTAKSDLVLIRNAPEV